MKTYHLDSFTKGWMVGDFEPSIIRTPHCEFMVRYYKAGDTETMHVHKVASEITVCVSGKFIMAGIPLGPGDIIHLDPGDPADFTCIEDGATAVLKMPSVMGDKYPVV
jgi:quercetin dioxygenase-like cupin family protein